MSRREPEQAAKSRVAGAGAVKRVSIRLTRNTGGYVALLFALWYAALSQGNGAAYALFFFIVAAGMISWLHARRNLRGLILTAARVEPVFTGMDVHVPLSVTASRGSFAAGLEIRARAASSTGKASAEVARCGFIRAGQTANVTLILPASQRGVFANLPVEIRSLWPFGLFTAEASLDLDCTYVVQPEPAGAQPLPAGEAGWQYDRKKGRGDGDEFAGLREFRAGESSRRIHWRASERTGKLLTKEWEGASGGMRWLDWNAVELADINARLAQLSRWVLEADRTGSPYGLRLPGHEIPAAAGPAHRTRCLHALAAFSAPVPPAQPTRRTRPPEPQILPGPFAGLLVALALSALPILTTVQPVSAAIFGLAILFRFISRKKAVVLRSLPAKLLVIGIGLGSVLASGGGILGLKPGTSLLVGLIALKILESATRRDFYVLVLLTWFLALCGLFVSQTLLSSTVATLLCALAAIAAAVLYSEGQMPWKTAGKRTIFIALQGVPILVLFFLFFPRVQGGFRLSLKPNGLGEAGFSEDFDPGNFTKLNDNFDTAFRAEFLDGEPPSPADRYWRGLVLWQCDGLEWHRGSVNMVEGRVPKPPTGSFWQRITLQPHGARWLFALDRPLFPVRESTLEPGGFLQANRPVNYSTRYEVVSLPRIQDRVLPRIQRTAALRVPSNLPPQTKALAESLKKAGDDAAILASGIQWFQRQKFTYSLSPDRYVGAYALDDFLFHRRTGFCSHYASAFSTLMRAAGLPSRVVLGYQGGEYNPHGRYFLVRQNDAHAWSEIWIEGRGWQRVDLTQQLAPSRIESGSERFREATDEGFAGRFHAPFGLSDLFGKARMLWDNLNYQWDLRVVSFDEDSQFEFLANIGLKDVPRPVLAGGVIAVGCILFGVAGLWLRRTTRRRLDPAARAWTRACHEIERLTGLEREVWEGPYAYAERAGMANAHAAPAIRSAANAYAQIRFSPRPPTIEKLNEATAGLRRFKRTK